MRLFLRFLIVSTSLVCGPALSQTNISGNPNAIIIIGDGNSIADALKAASVDKRTPEATAIVTRNYTSEKDAVYLGILDNQGFQIINNLKSSEDYHYYRFSTKDVGVISIAPSRNANSFEYGIMELGGTVIVDENSYKSLEQFFPPGEYILFAKRNQRPTPYQFSIKLNPT